MYLHIYLYTHVFSIFRYIHSYPFSSLHETLKTRCWNSNRQQFKCNLGRQKSQDDVHASASSNSTPALCSLLRNETKRSWGDVVGGGVIVNHLQCNQQPQQVLGIARRNNYQNKIRDGKLPKWSLGSILDEFKVFFSGEQL